MRASGALVVFSAVALLFPLPSLVMPAGAHAGSRAQLYVASARVESRPGGWVFVAMLRDLDSGRPEPGFSVRIRGSAPNGGSFGPISLVDPSGTGQYEGVLPPAAGTWALTVDAEEIPGGSAALPSRRTWNVILEPGKAIQLSSTRHQERHGSGSQARFMLRLLVLAGLGALASVAVNRLRPRRSSSQSSPTTGIEC